MSFLSKAVKKMCKPRTDTGFPLSEVSTRALLMKVRHSGLNGSEICWCSALCLKTIDNSVNVFYSSSQKP